MSQREEILKRVKGAVLEDIVRIGDLADNIKLVLTFTNFDEQICIMEITPSHIVNMGSKLVVSPEISMVISDWVVKPEVKEQDDGEA